VAPFAFDQFLCGEKEGYKVASLAIPFHLRQDQIAERPTVVQRSVTSRRHVNGMFPFQVQAFNFAKDLQSVDPEPFHRHR